jgi:hypothetical protein
MRRIVEMAKLAAQEADEALKTVKKNRPQAERLANFMTLCRLMTQYYEEKVATATEALVYAETGRAEDRRAAERLANRTVALYGKAVRFMKDKLPELETGNLQGFGEKPVKDLNELVAMEKTERSKLGKIFGWPQ